MKKIRNIVVMFLVAIIFCGCSITGRENLFETKRYRLEVDNVEDCTLDEVSRERDGQLHIEGNMTFSHHADWPLSGDVQAQIYGPRGNLLQTKNVAFEPLEQARHVHPAARFQFVFDQIPPAGSLIKLSHTLRPFDGNVDDPIIR